MSPSDFARGYRNVAILRADMPISWGRRMAELVFRVFVTAIEFRRKCLKQLRRQIGTDKLNSLPVANFPGVFTQLARVVQQNGRKVGRRWRRREAGRD